MEALPYPLPDVARADEDEVRIGISACLLGAEVRHDGGHKRERFLTDTLARFVTFVPVCPELELGLGVPRPAIRLVADPGGAPRLVERDGGRDLTRAMDRYAARRLRELEAFDLDGFLLKKDSPSCGLFRVKVWSTKGVLTRDGRGRFARALVERFPHLPVEEEGRLHDPPLRESFLERVFAWRRLRAFFLGHRRGGPRWTLGRLVAFHTSEKLFLLAHEERGYRELGRLVADGKGTPRAELAERYQSAFLAILARPASPRRHVNVLQHAAGHFKELASRADRAELAGVIEDYGRGLVPLVVPLTLVRHLARHHGVDWLLQQTYFAPHPKELMLRNHV